jgi:hypothetical protein
MSGGLPHSEICGSKPIPGSPQLNAGYHVLHRLLLPRHPPNALFALDLIQKEQGSNPEVKTYSFRCRPEKGSQAIGLTAYNVSKAVYFPMLRTPKGSKRLVY